MYSLKFNSLLIRPWSDAGWCFRTACWSASVTWSCCMCTCITNKLHKLSDTYMNNLNRPIGLNGIILILDMFLIFLLNTLVTIYFWSVNSPFEATCKCKTSTCYCQKNILMILYTMQTISQITNTTDMCLLCVMYTLQALNTYSYSPNFRQCLWSVHLIAALKTMAFIYRS